jgi:hypothetical protein
METLGDEILPKFCSKFYCIYCDYNTSKKSSYNTHLLSAKHKKKASGDALVDKCDGDYAKNMLFDKKYSCIICNKKYISRNGLWRHKQKCFEENVQANEPTEKELIMMLIKQNSQLIEQNATLVKNGINNTTTNSHNNHSNNKTFNLQFFLNETCKDAMNLTDFVNSIQLQLSDLERVGDSGYVKGISDIIINNLNDLDVTQRPVHCADKKREVLYIKHEDKWEKENEDKNNIRQAIRRIANKNSNLLLEFKEIHPECKNHNSKYSDQYNKMIIEAYGGTGDNDREKENKIIHNIAKNVIINKGDDMAL